MWVTLSRDPDYRVIVVLDNGAWKPLVGRDAKTVALRTTILWLLNAPKGSGIAWLEAHVGEMVELTEKQAKRVL